MTVGVELEWADVDRRQPIDPQLGQWNSADYTIVNSDGHANDPTGTDWPYGGEINTAPTASWEEQSHIVAKLAAQLHPTINYRCNLHVHVRVPLDLQESHVVGDLDCVPALKRLAQYFRDAQAWVYSVVEPIPKPLVTGDKAADAGASRRYRRRLVSHHYALPASRWAELMRATTPREFYDAHAPLTAIGQRNWAIAPRPGMNLRSLWKHGTIEYRHFPGSCDPREIGDCARWAVAFTAAALIGTPPAPVLYATGKPWYFPEFRPYDHQLETGYLATAYRPQAASRVRVHR